MFEIRLRPRQLLILIIIFFTSSLLIHRSGRKLCDVDKRDDLPVIYAITPTYARPAQKAELTRLSYVFMLTPNLHWIIVEDSNSSSPLVSKVIERAKLIERVAHLYVKTPPEFKLKAKDPNWIKPRGVEQRNVALSWLHKNADKTKRSLVFFMDDDNTYSLELFDEIAKIERGRVGVWPVGLVGGLMVEKPLLSEDKSQVIGFNAAWRPNRPYPIDMAAFAVSFDLFLAHPEAKFSYNVQRGYQESEILRHLTTREKLQPLANNCQDVLVWHTRTEPTKLDAEKALLKQGKQSDAGIEV